MDVKDDKDGWLLRSQWQMTKTNLWWTVEVGLSECVKWGPNLEGMAQVAVPCVVWYDSSLPWNLSPSVIGGCDCLFPTVYVKVPKAVSLWRPATEVRKSPCPLRKSQLKLLHRILGRALFAWILHPHLHIFLETPPLIFSYFLISYSHMF